MFKKLASLVLVLALVAFATPAFAQARHGIQSTKGFETHQNAILPAGTWVYGIKLYADASSSFMAIHDCLTQSVATVANAVDEIGEATQYDSVEVWYPRPIYFSTAVSVSITTGVGYIFYGPAPSTQ